MGETKKSGPLGIVSRSIVWESAATSRPGAELDSFLRDKVPGIEGSPSTDPGVAWTLLERTAREQNADSYGVKWSEDEKTFVAWIGEYFEGFATPEDGGMALACCRAVVLART